MDLIERVIACFYPYELKNLCDKKIKKLPGTEGGGELLQHKCTGRTT